MIFIIRYEEDFKRMIVEINKTGRSVRGLAKEHGLSEATIYKWKSLYISNKSTGLAGKETAELRKENARLKEELEVPRSVYYFYKNKPLTATEIRNNKLKKENIDHFF